MRRTTSPKIANGKAGICGESRRSMGPEEAIPVRERPIGVFTHQGQGLPCSLPPDASDLCPEYRRFLA